MLRLRMKIIRCDEFCACDAMGYIKECVQNLCHVELEGVDESEVQAASHTNDENHPDYQIENGPKLCFFFFELFLGLPG